MLRCEIIPPSVPHELCCEIIKIKIRDRLRLRRLALVLGIACMAPMAVVGFRTWLEKPSHVDPPSTIYSPSTIYPSTIFVPSTTYPSTSTIFVSTGGILSSSNAPYVEHSRH